MTFEEYQKRSLTTVITNPDPLMDKTIFAMGISGEAGEVLEKWKKIVAYNDGNITEQDKQNLQKELGDVIWYVSVFANSLGIALEDIAAHNLDKLADRKKRDVQKGEGDHR